jgi:hypothetical protein
MKKTLLLFFVLFGFQAISQDKKLAANYYESGNFEEALDLYVELANANPDNADFNYRAGVCYLNTNVDKKKAITFFQRVIKQPKFDPNAYYFLGMAYQFALEFDKAIKAYENFRERGMGSPENLQQVSLQIMTCQNGKELIKFPVNVTFENLGPEVNSAFADYYPFVPANESFILFNSRRDENKEMLPNGNYPSSVFISEEVQGKFTKAQRVDLGFLGIEEVVGLTASGDTAIFYLENLNSFGDIFFAQKRKKGFKKPVKFDKTINSKYTELAACISSDGRQLFFASDRPGGYGGLDLYLCQLLPNGKWGEPLNLGPKVNTPYDDDFPNLSPDNKTLYFSSKGHTSMGGYDIFKVEWNAEKRIFGSVMNLGYPINTPADNMNFRISSTGRYGYVSTQRDDSYGDLDIYRVTFNDVESEYTVYTGKVMTPDSTFNFEDVLIQVTDKEGDIYGDYIPNRRTGRYVMILLFGEYSIFVGAIGYGEHYEKLNVYDKSSFQTEVAKDFVLLPVDSE